jgi:hypothetical protein
MRIFLHKKVGVLFTVLLLVTVMGVSLVAVMDVSTTSKAASTTEMTQPSLAGCLGPQHPHNAKTGKLISCNIVTVTGKSKASSSRMTQPHWLCNCFYLKNIQPAGTGNTYLASAQGSNPYLSTVSLEINQSVSNQWSATGGIDSGTVSAQIGFSVTETQGVNQTGSANIPQGQTVEIDAFAIFDVSTYDVWYNPVLGNDFQVGSGNAWDYANKIEFDAYQVS